MANIYSLVDTWNSVGTTFSAIKMDVTDTASASDSKLLDLLVGGVSKFNVSKAGIPTIYGANMPVQIGNGGWAGTDFAVPYFRPASAGGHIALDVMPNGGPDDVWIDICSHDITNGSGNYETLKLFKAYNGDAYIRTTKAGNGTQRSLQLGGATTKLTYGASNTVGWTVDGSGGLVAGTSTGVFVPTVANSTLASIGCSTATTSGFYTVNGFDWGYTRSGAAVWLSGFNVLRLAATASLGWSATEGDPSASTDIALTRSAAGILVVTNGSTGGGAMELREQTAPSSPSSNSVRIYAEDNGSGKTRLMALFPTGSAQQIAIEP